MAPSPPGFPAVLVLAPPRFLAPLGAMRSLGSLGVRVYGLKHKERSIASASRFCAGTVAVGRNGQPADAATELILAQLLAAGRQLGPGTILLAGSDEWATFLAVHRSELASYFLFPHVPVELVRVLASKAGLHELARTHGVRTPRVAVPAGIEEAVEMAEQLRYPLVLKQVARDPGKETLELVEDREALSDRFAAVGDAGNVLLQEYVRAEDSDVWMFNGYFDGSSRCLAGFTARKIRQHPARMGICTIGTCEQNDDLALASERFLAAVGYRGIVDIDYLWDRLEGTYKILDVNPRLGGAFRLMVDRSGLDVVRAMYLDLTGRSVARPEPQIGRKWIIEAADLIACHHYRRDHGLTFRAWLRSLQGLQEGATLSRTDPLPFLVAMKILAADTMNGRLARVAAGIRGALSRLWPAQAPASSGRMG